MAVRKGLKAALDLKGKTLTASDLIAVQSGAVVSREIIRGKAGSVTAFAFDACQQLSEHTAPFDALVIGLEGTADITIGGKSHLIVKDQMIIMPAGTSHGLKAVSRFKMLLVMIRS